MSIQLNIFGKLGDAKQLHSLHHIVLQYIISNHNAIQ